jgi:spore coat polysaccharide biosynthesis predicted glycosyltransferase SpsG
MNPVVYIRCDGGTNIGMGHVVRCLALAHMIKKHFDVVFILQETDTTIYQWIEKNGFTYQTIARSSEEKEAASQVLNVLK